MNQPYMIQGLNDLNAWMKANDKFASETLMRYIERQMVMRVMLAKKEATQQNLDTELKLEANRHGGPQMMYRHYANQHMDIVYKKSMVKLEHNTKMIRDLQELEYENSLYQLQARNGNAQSIFQDIRKVIKEMKSLFGETKHDNPASKSHKKVFMSFIENNPIVQAAEKFAQEAETIAQEVEKNAFAYVKKMEPEFGMFGGK